VVTDGFALTFCVAGKPPVQLNEPPGSEGLAVKLAVSPSQMIALFTVTVGVGLTEIVPDPVAIQPFKS
jgi:hypothetical protein